MGVYYRPSRTNYKEAVLGDGPLAYWRLDETSGTTATDLAGHSSGPFNATYNGSPTLNQSGVMDDGLSNPSVDFDAINDYAVTADDNTLKFLSAQAFTAESWVNADTTQENNTDDTTRSIVGCHNSVTASDEDGWRLFWTEDAGGDLQFVFERQNGTSQDAVSKGGYDLNTAYHVVGTFDGSTIRLYVNGVLVASAASTVSIPSAGQNGATIGTTETGSGDYTGFGLADGQLDEITLYDRALTGQEIAEHYAIGTQGSVGKRWIDLTRYVKSERR